MFSAKVVDTFSESSSGYLVYNQNWKFVEYISNENFNKPSYDCPRNFTFIEVISLGDDKFISNQGKIFHVVADVSDDSSNMSVENIINAQHANKVLSELIEDIKSKLSLAEEIANKFELSFEFNHENTYVEIGDKSWMSSSELC